MVIKKLNKVAQTEMYFILIQIILILATAFFLTMYVASIKDNTLYQKNYLAEDISLTYTTILSSPGKINYSYSSKETGINLSLFDIVFDNEKVIVEKDSLAAQQYYINNQMTVKTDTEKNISFFRDNIKYLPENYAIKKVYISSDSKEVEDTLLSTIAVSSEIRSVNDQNLADISLFLEKTDSEKQIDFFISTKNINVNRKISNNIAEKISSDYQVSSSIIPKEQKYDIYIRFSKDINPYFEISSILGDTR